MRKRIRFYALWPYFHTETIQNAIVYIDNASTKWRRLKTEPYRIRVNREHGMEKEGFRKITDTGNATNMAGASISRMRRWLL